MKFTIISNIKFIFSKWNNNIDTINGDIIIKFVFTSPYLFKRIWWIWLLSASNGFRFFLNLYKNNLIKSKKGNKKIIKIFSTFSELVELYNLITINEIMKEKM